MYKEAMQANAAIRSDTIRYDRPESKTAKKKQIETHTKNYSLFVRNEYDSVSPRSSQTSGRMAAEYEKQ